MPVSRRAWIQEALRAISMGVAALVGALGIRSAASRTPARTSSASRTPAFEVVTSDGRTIKLSSRCPHLGCTVQPDADGFVCPCHGSRFDREGKWISGPAKRDLERLA